MKKIEEYIEYDTDTGTEKHYIFEDKEVQYEFISKFNKKTENIGIRLRFWDIERWYRELEKHALARKNLKHSYSLNGFLTFMGDLEKIAKENRLRPIIDDSSGFYFNFTVAQMKEIISNKNTIIDIFKFIENEIKFKLLQNKFRSELTKRNLLLNAYKNL